MEQIFDEMSGQNRLTDKTNVNIADDRLLFIDLYRDLRRFAAVVADVDMDPDDLVQDTLIAVLRRHSFHSLDNPRAYLKRAIVNLASTKRRRFGVWRGLLPKAARSSSYKDFYPSDLAVLEALSPQDRAVLYMADVEGYPHAEIADHLELSVSVVRKRASRARARLRDALTKESDDVSNVELEPKGRK